MNKKPPSFPYDHLAILGVKKIKKYIPPSKEWCKQMAELEGDSEVGVGVGPGFNPVSEDLAPLVEKIAEKMAEDINKSGIQEQLKFLEANGWDRDAVIKFLKEYDEDNL